MALFCKSAGGVSLACQMDVREPRVYTRLSLRAGVPGSRSETVFENSAVRAIKRLFESFRSRPGSTAGEFLRRLMPYPSIRDPQGVRSGSAVGPTALN